MFWGAYSSLVDLNWRSEICLYCGLVAPNRDFIYFFVSDAVCTNPVSGLYRGLVLLYACIAPCGVAVYCVCIGGFHCREFDFKAWHGEFGFIGYV